MLVMTNPLLSGAPNAIQYPIEPIGTLKGTGNFPPMRFEPTTVRSLFLK